jgi:zinc protease
MSVVLAQDRTDPVVAVSLVFEGGSRLDPEGREGLATLAADTMERGPRGEDFVAFSRRFERLGSQLSLGAGAELVHGDLTLLSRHAATGLSLLADLLAEPGLREEDLEVVRRLAINDLEAREDDLDDVAEDLLLKRIAGPHPYARLPHGTREGLLAVTAEDLGAFCAEAYRPDRAHLAIIGDFDDAEIDRLLAARFETLRVPPAARTPLAPLPDRSAEDRVVCTRSDKAQAKICFGGPGLSANDPDRLAAIALNHVLGGSAIRSRLGDGIRDRAGLAYSVGSRNYERSVGGFFLVSLGTRPANVRQAVDSVRAEIARLGDGATAQELSDAQEYLTGSFPLRFTTYGRLARFWTRSAFYGWPEDYLDRYAERVRALAAADLRRVGARLAASCRCLSVAGPVDDDLAPLPSARGDGDG